MIKIILDKIEKYWYYPTILILLIVVFFLFNKTSVLEASVQTSLDKAKESDLRAKFHIDVYNLQMEKDAELLARYDSLLLEKSKIKKVYYEKIKMVDKYSVADLQQFFDERTK